VPAGRVRHTAGGWMSAVQAQVGTSVLRAGWVAKGALYVVVGLLALQVAASGGSDERADQQGALRAVRDQPLGRPLLVVLTIGLLLYAVWRLLEAATVDTDSAVDRGGHALSGLLHLGLAVVAARLALGSDDGGGGGGDEAPTITARVMEATGGRWLVGAVGLTIAAVGVRFVVEGLRRDFLDDLAAAGAERRWLEPLGVVGSVARGVVFLVVGWFLVRAAVQYDAQEARGLDGALHTLAEQAFGPVLLFAVAAGLIAYGLFAALSARSRRPPA
jgi:hypothetical protein